LRQIQIVFAQVVTKRLSAKHFHYLGELVVVVRSFKESIHSEKHSRKSAACRPNVQTVVVASVVNKQLGALVVATGNTNVVVCIRLIVVCQTPINKAQVSLRMIYDNIKGLNISMHDAVSVGVLKGLQDFVDVKADVHTIELIVELLGVNGRDPLKDEGGSFCGCMKSHVKEFYDVGPAIKSLQDFGFAVDFFDAHGFKDFYNTALIVESIGAQVDFRVFTTT
jgi:hypothetical protein